MKEKLKEVEVNKMKASPTPGSSGTSTALLTKELAQLVHVSPRATVRPIVTVSSSRHVRSCREPWRRGATSRQQEIELEPLPILRGAVLGLVSSSKSLVLHGASKMLGGTMETMQQAQRLYACLQ